MPSRKKPKKEPAIVSYLEIDGEKIPVFANRTIVETVGFVEVNGEKISIVEPVLGKKKKAPSQSPLF